MEKPFVVGIIGAGIGGAALARALWRKGISFQLFDQAPEFGEVGAGIQMTPNAVKVLHALGLNDEIDRVGFLPEAMIGRNWDVGEELFRTPIKGTFDDLFGAPYYHIHRADLHDAIVKDLPEEYVNFNAKCVGVESRGDKKVAKFANGDEFEADLLIGADGIRSVVRDSLWGKDTPEFTGHMAWRALVPVEEFPLPFVQPAVTFWFGPKAHVVTYYVKGGKAVNIVACKETDDWVKESWSEPSSTEELVQAFNGWHPDLIKLFERTDSPQVFKWGLYDRDPMKKWSLENATLLGDAAHPMLPYLSQGAAMALEDGYVLAEALSYFEGEVSLALEAYEAERRDRTSNVQLQSRERGKTYHLESDEEQKKRDEEMRKRQAENPNAVGISAEWIYEYDATKCHERFEKFERSINGHTLS